MLNKIVEIKDPKEFKKFIQGKQIRVSPHALDRLDYGQRGIFTEEGLRLPLLRAIPHFVAVQINQRYTVYYQQKELYLNLILELKEDGSLEIISFMKKRTLPITKHE